MKGMELQMKKILLTVMLLTIMVILGCNQVYAAENVLDAQNESQLIQMKENAAKTLEEYKNRDDEVKTIAKLIRSGFLYCSLQTFNKFLVSSRVL